MRQSACSSSAFLRRGPGIVALAVTCCSGRHGAKFGEAPHGLSAGAEAELEQAALYAHLHGPRVMNSAAQTSLAVLPPPPGACRARITSSSRAVSPGRRATTRCHGEPGQPRNTQADLARRHSRRAAAGLPPDTPTSRRRGGPPDNPVRRHHRASPSSANSVASMHGLFGALGPRTHNFPMSC